MDAARTVRLENERCRLTFTTVESAASCRVELRDKRTGLRLQSGLAEVEAMWDALQRFEIQPDLKLVRVEQLSDATATFIFLAQRARIEFTLAVSLENAEFTTTVPWPSVRENRRDHFRLFGIRPLPGLMRTSAEGALLVPVQSGALVYPARHGPMRDRLLIYGEQWRWEDLPLLPVCAMFERNAGLAVIAERGDCDSQYEIHIDADRTGTGGFSCRYRYHWPDPVDPLDRVFRHVLLDEDSANYAGVGRRMNRFVRETLGMKTLEEKGKQSPQLRYAAEAMTMKISHAMKDLDHENGDGAYHVFQTFAETKEHLRELKDAGIEKVYAQLVGWNVDGHDGRYPTRFPVDERLGGEPGFRDLIRAGQRLGFQMQVHDNYADSTDPRADFLIRNLWGEPLPRGIWAGGVIYGINPRKLGEERAKRDMLRLREMGVDGVYYLDDMGAPLEVDYDSQRGGPRRAHAEGLAWIVRQGREVFGACGTECGYAYIALHSDYIGSSPLRNLPSFLRSHTPIQLVIDERVPLWQMTFHGMLIHSTFDAPIPTLDKLLEAAETGGSPRSDFSGANPDPGSFLFAAQWDHRLLPAYKAKHDLLINRLGKNQFAFIQNHAKLGDQRYQTVFSNGCVVEVDYQGKNLSVDGKKIPIPDVFDRKLPIRTK